MLMYRSHDSMIALAGLEVSSIGIQTSDPSRLDHINTDTAAHLDMSTTSGLHSWAAFLLLQLSPIWKNSQYPFHHVLFLSHEPMGCSTPPSVLLGCKHEGRSLWSVPLKHWSASTTIPIAVSCYLHQHCYRYGNPWREHEHFLWAPHPAAQLLQLKKFRNITDFHTGEVFRILLRSVYSLPFLFHTP